MTVVKARGIRAIYLHGPESTHTHTHRLGRAEALTPLHSNSLVSIAVSRIRDKRFSIAKSASYVRQDGNELMQVFDYPRSVMTINVNEKRER